MGSFSVLYRRISSVLSKPFVKIGGLGKLLEAFYQEYNVNKILDTKDRVYKKLKIEFNDSQVKYGPFAGMKYPELEGVGSELFPKLLGCYEVELFDWLDKIQVNQYDKIINVGCAEGYYAVGLGMRFPQSTIYAYDLSERARELCQEMGDKNGITKRLKVHSKCTAQTLQKLDFGKRSLIVCDCEGYELELFTKENMGNLGNCDVLIELHDFINPAITATLLPLFSATHDVEIYRSMDDDLKIIHLSEKYKELSKLNEYEKKVALGEMRPTTMEWAYLTPKKIKNGVKTLKRQAVG